MSKLNELTITEASAKLAAGETTSLEITEACVQEAGRRNPALNAYLEIFDDAREQARRADERRAAGERHPLLGIPLAVKDNILIEGRHASAASKMLEHYVATYDSTVIRKLREAGAVFVGRANMDEFAHGGTTENSAFGATRNPLDESRVPGGSSGGSAAAVASGMALGALGTDTGGSIRQPASFCGLVGLKPTYGAVSRAGLIAMGSSLDQAGPLCRSIEDAQLLFEAIRGQDMLDSTTIGPHTYPPRAARKKIGVPRQLLAQGVEQDVLERFNESLERLKRSGYEIVDIEMPLSRLALAVYYVVMPAEVSANLARFDGVRYGLSVRGESLEEDYACSRAAGFGPEPRRRIMLGTYVLSSGYYDAYFGKAMAVRAQLRAEVEEVLSRVDLIATPTTTTPAAALGEKTRDPLSMYLMDIFTVTANLTGNPAISLPMGTVERGGSQLPVGMQFTAAHGDEAALFAAGKELQ